MHALVGLLSIIVLAVAPFVAARTLRRSPDWADSAPRSVALGAALVVSLVAYVVLSESGGSASGYAQRALALIGSAWIVLLALRALRVSRREG